MPVTSISGCSMPRSPDAIAVAPAAARPVVALMVDDLDWHARRLVRALRARGAVPITAQLTDCLFDTRQPAGLVIPPCGDRLPDAALVRTMSGGSFEAVTLRLGLLHALGELGVMVWNSARAIERCVDKSTTSFLLARAGIPTPATWTMESPAAVRTIVEAEIAGGPLVLKPLFGSQGRGLRLIRGVDDLPQPGEVAGVYYLQRFVAIERDGFHDFRLFVSNGRVVAAMMRHAAHWITNVKRGGRPIAVVPDGTMKDLAVAAAAAVGAAFAGVDILHGTEGLTVLEVNSMPAWSGLQRVTPVDVAAILAGDLLAALRLRQESSG
jgi:tetrahydromethanopterin:alpha-L-glutamate ligase